jgi:hypothetical protein
MSDQPPASEETLAQNPLVTEHPPAPGLPEAPAYEPAAEDDDDWLQEEPEQLPARPRRRLLAPLPVALLVLLMTACGFIGGLLVEKGQGSSSGAAGAASGLAARLAGLRGGGGGTGGRDLGAASAAGAGGVTVGQVAFIEGSTLYVTDAQGNTIKVTTSRASTVTKSVKSSVASVHPGETVAITGTPSAGGTVNAETIRVGEGFGGGLAALFGGPRGGSGSSSGSSSGAGGGGEPALFGKGG